MRVSTPQVVRADVSDGRRRLLASGGNALARRGRRKSDAVTPGASLSAAHEAGAPLTLRPPDVSDFWLARQRRVGHVSGKTSRRVHTH